MAWLDEAPQTNEGAPGRGTDPCDLVGLWRATICPVTLSELGASAGLNLSL